MNLDKSESRKSQTIQKGSYNSDSEKIKFSSACVHGFRSLPSWFMAWMRVYGCATDGCSAPSESFLLLGMWSIECCWPRDGMSWSGVRSVRSYCVRPGSKDILTRVGKPSDGFVGVLVAFNGNIFTASPVRVWQRRCYCVRAYHYQFHQFHLFSLLFHHFSEPMQSKYYPESVGVCSRSSLRVLNS